MRFQSVAATLFTSLLVSGLAGVSGPISQANATEKGVERNINQAEPLDSEAAEPAADGAGASEAGLETKTSAAPSPRAPVKKPPPGAPAWRLQGGISWSIGSMGFKSGAFDSRTMNALAFKAFPNFDLQTVLRNLPFKLVVGPFAEFRVVGQLTDPASVQTSNIRGTGWLLGLGFAAELEKWSILASIDPFGAHYLTNRIPTDQTSNFSSAFGTRIVIGYMVRPDVSVDFNFQYAAYDHNNVVGSLGNDALTQTLVGIGARYFFDL